MGDRAPKSEPNAEQKSGEVTKMAVGSQADSGVNKGRAKKNSGCTSGDGNNTADRDDYLQ